MKIVLSVILGLFLVGCSEDTTQETTKAEVKKEVVKKELPKPVKAKVEVAQEAPIPAVQEVKKEVIEVAPVAVEVVEEKLKDVTPTATTNVNEAGKKAYKACSSCHGNNAEKMALGKSKIIKGWSEDKTLNALAGYKDGTYGGAMKALMAGQAKMLSDENAKLVAKYISTL